MAAASASVASTDSGLAPRATSRRLSSSGSARGRRAVTIACGNYTSPVPWTTSTTPETVAQPAPARAKVAATKYWFLAFIW